MKNEHEQQMTEVFRTLFNLPELELRDDLTAPQVPGWDSFNHVNLIIQLEQTFGVRFTNDEVSGLKNVGEMKELIASKLE